MNETWSKWIPIAELQPKYYITSISDDNTVGFQIMMSPRKDLGKKIRVHFVTSVEAYRLTDESYIGKTIHFLHEKYGPEFYSKWTFFKVENSEYMKWFFEHSAGMAEIRIRPFTHFVILSTESMFDLINTGEPIVEFID